MSDEERRRDEEALDRLYADMKAKLARKRKEGRGGWWNPAECKIEHLVNLFVEHAQRDPVDIVDLANFLMMIRERGGEYVLKLAIDPQQTKIEALEEAAQYLVITFGMESRSIRAEVRPGHECANKIRALIEKE